MTSFPWLLFHFFLGTAVPSPCRMAATAIQACFQICKYRHPGQHLDSCTKIDSDRGGVSTANVLTFRMCKVVFQAFLCVPCSSRLAAKGPCGCALLLEDGFASHLLEYACSHGYVCCLTCILYMATLILSSFAFSMFHCTHTSVMSLYSICNLVLY